MLFLRTSYKFNEDLIAVCVCVFLQEKTKELAQKQAQQSVSLSKRNGDHLSLCVSVFNPLLHVSNSQDPASLSLLSISDLIPDLQTIFFWMSNSIEILYFIQQRAPAYTHTIETLQGTHSSAPAEPLVTLTPITY